jgi:pimeloyl-ACP methyl ester carboxylesterase
MVKFEPITSRYVFLQVQGIEYRVYFEEAGQGIPVLCQHTAGADGLQWRQLMNDEEVTSRFRVIAADLPYHGKSLPPESVEWWSKEYKLTQSFFIDFLIEFSRALSLEKPVFMGCSMGGTLALDLALERPDDFRAVVGIEAGEYIPGFYIDWFDHPRIGGNLRIANLYDATAPQSPEKYRREVGWVYGKSAPSVFRGDLYYYSVEHNLTGKLDKIDTSRIPVYILCGEYDIATPPEMGRRACSQIKGARFCEMAEMGHFPVIENYEHFKSYLMPILNEIADKS